jgi:hypothetical protein
MQKFYNEQVRCPRRRVVVPASGDEWRNVMADDQTTGSNTEKDPDEWVTGDEPMTGAQASYLKTLSQEADEDFDESLSKADASKRIEELQQKTGRGVS